MIQVQGERAARPYVGWEHEDYLLQKITITSDDTLLLISSGDPNQQELEIHRNQLMKRVVQFKCIYLIMIDSPSFEIIVVYTFNWLIFKKYFAVFDGSPSSEVCFRN